jgi:hypothetical protein
MEEVRETEQVEVDWESTARQTGYLIDVEKMGKQDLEMEALEA